MPLFFFFFFFFGKRGHLQGCFAHYTLYFTTDLPPLETLTSFCPLFQLQILATPLLTCFYFFCITVHTNCIIFFIAEERMNLAFLTLPLLFEGRRPKGGKVSAQEASQHFIEMQKVMDPVYMLFCYVF